MKKLFTASELDDYEVGSKEYFEFQKRAIFRKKLLKYCYDTWYDGLIQDANLIRNPVREGEILLELGSGGSYLKDRLPELITSDVVEGVADRVVDGRELPFEDASVRAIFLTHAFHHIPDVERFLSEAYRVLRPGGVVAMIEVAHTPLARFFFDRMHPEPYEDCAADWRFEQVASMMDSHQALSWMVFVRDRKRFQALYPNFRVTPMRFMPWFTYLVSGGVTRGQILPGFLAPRAYLAEYISIPLRSLFALHWRICIQKAD
mgnify:CR=1 FL=1